MSTFTCITCRVAFEDGEIQRLHYKCDWHRYNLKRKVADLPPVASEEFQRRVLLQRQNDKDQVSDKSVYCTACHKSFGNEKAFENHLSSKKHKENARSVSQTDTLKVPSTRKDSENVTVSVEEDSDVEEVDSDEWDENAENPIDQNNCLFCMHHSRNLLKNVHHMTLEHSFFIPDIEYCVDLKGLLVYLGEKINQGFMCLWCNEKGKTFHSAEAAMQHMIDKGHCKMIHEGLALAEYADFYDYSSSYPDADKDIDTNEEVDVPEIDGSDYQLVLPSGAVVGHRSLMRYYRQNLDPNSAVAVSRSSKKLHKVLAHYRALGWSATQQEAAAKKARDIHYMKRLQSRLNIKLQIKANKLQTHFRPQVNF